MAQPICCDEDFELESLGQWVGISLATSIYDRLRSDLLERKQQTIYLIKGNNIIGWSTDTLETTEQPTATKCGVGISSRVCVNYAQALFLRWTPSLRLWLFNCIIANWYPSKVGRISTQNFTRLRKREGILSSTRPNDSYYRSRYRSMAHWRCPPSLRTISTEFCSSILFFII